MAFMEVFRRQFWALFVKNWIVLSKHPYLNVLRCFIFPIAYGIFLAVAQLFLSKPDNYGIGQPSLIVPLKDNIDGSLALYWADGTNGTGFPSPSDIMAHVTSGFTSAQLRVVHQVNTQADITQACPQNFNLFSECFAAVTFDAMPSSANDTAPLNYTIMVDGGLVHIDVVKHTSDYEKRVLPLQWALDSAIVELRTGSQIPTPLEWPFTQETNTEQFIDIRLSYVRGLRQLLVLALFICYIGIAYQLPGSFMGERANLLTSHLQAMGLRNSARIISWHISITVAYLPAWVIVAIIWHFRIFSGTHILIVLLYTYCLDCHWLAGLFFIGAPFGNSPQLAAVATTFMCIIFAILAQAFGRASTGVAFIYSIIFPPGFYIFAIRAIAGFEVHRIPTNVLHGDPDNNLSLLPLIIAAIIDIFLWPYLAVLLERKLYDAREPYTSSWLCCFRKHKSRASDNDAVRQLPSDTAISIRNLNKTYSSSWWKWRKQDVTAIADLTLDIPKFGIFVLLGSNGAGKSTALSILAGLQGRTSGNIMFEDGLSRPQHGVLGIVPQKNVLFPELTCYQTVKVWKAIKRPKNSADDEDSIQQLLRDCDLEHKINANAETLSGGQKRKLQLAVGLVGGSKIVLVDECTSGVDPLSRRALWRTLTSVRDKRTIVFTTHFLDEADLLGDNIAILAAPGKLVASGSPVSLKSTLGEGYRLHISLASSQSGKTRPGPPPELLERIREVAQDAHMILSSATSASYHLKSKDSATVERVLSLLEQDKIAFGIASYEVHGTSMEDIFLSLMNTHGQGLYSKEVELQSTGDAEKIESKRSNSSKSNIPRILQLTNGRRRSAFSQAFTIFHKRYLIARRSWLSPVLSLIVAVAGSCIPLFFLSGLNAETCVKAVQTTSTSTSNVSLFFPLSPLQISSLLDTSGGNTILTSPPDIVGTLGPSVASLQTTNVQDNTTFMNDINQNFRNLSLGGISMDLSSGNSLVAWEATPPGLTGPTMLNLATNILYNNALNSSGQGSVVPSIIMPNFLTFPGIAGGTLTALKWEVFFGAAMAVFPAFYALYVSNERRTSVQAMQLSNGLADPAGLWLGHLLFDSMFSVSAATIIIIIFAAVANQLHGLGLFWVVLVLYGISGALFAYCFSLVTASPLAAFAAVAGYQFIMFLLYVAGYLLTETYAKTSKAGQILTIIHFTLSVLSPVASPIRASFVSVNLFSLLCNSNSTFSTASLGSINKFGGPIAYLIIYIFVLFAFLVRFDSGSKLPQFSLGHKTIGHTETSASNSVVPKDVREEAEAVAISSDALRVMRISKKYRNAAMKAVDDVSFGVSHGTVLALLGPNGAGKTSAFNIIRGDTIPDYGDVLIQGTSVIRSPRIARLSLGVCPQFTAIDSQLSVHEHLMIYGRLKGLYSGDELNENIDILLESTALSLYADRLASKLSGGNQRKLSLAIALIGNPASLLIDEFSTGVDAKMKRDMWETLKNVAIGKAVVITTHSMEEASALASKVGIMAGKMLAIGSTQSLEARYPIYEIHFSCRTREEVVKAQELMARIPGSRKADDVATRFEVPIDEQNMTLADLFRTLSEYGDRQFADYTVERVSLENIFLKVIRENNIKEEDFAVRNRKDRSNTWGPGHNKLRTTITSIRQISSQPMHPSSFGVVSDMDENMNRVWHLITELSEQLAHNQKLVSTLQTQTSTLKGRALQSGNAYTLRRFNVDLTDDSFESELEHSNAQIVIENQTLLHENRQLSMLLKEHEQTMDTVMSKFRNHTLAAQQHELTLTRHYETLLLSREPNSDISNNLHTYASLHRLLDNLRMLLRSLEGEEEESPRNEQDKVLEDSGGFLEDVEREDWEVERECEIARLEKGNGELRKLLGIDSGTAKQLGWGEEELEIHRPILHVLKSTIASLIPQDGWGTRSPPQVQPFNTGPVPGNAGPSPSQNIPLQRTIEFQPGMRAPGTLRRPSMFGRGGGPFWGPSPPQERQWLQSTGGLDLAG